MKTILTKQTQNVFGKKTHPRITNALIDFFFKYSGSGGEFFYYFFTKIQLEESKTIPTAGVFFRNITPVMVYNSDFIDGLNDKELSFLLLHEVQHLIWGHTKRAQEHGYDPKLHNLATDMLINKILQEEYPWVTFIKGGVEWDDHYKGPEISDKIYEWLQEKADELKQKQQQADQNEEGNEGQGESKGKGEGEGKSQKGQSPGNQGDNQGDGEGSQGSAGKRHLKGSASEKTEQMLDDYLNQPNFTGETIDVHLPDEGNISEEIKKELVDEIIKEMKARGVVDGHMEKILDQRLKETPNNFLKLLKKSMASIKGKSPSRTYQRLNRRIPGKIKGKKGVANKINVILDASGSMMGKSIDKVANEIFKDGYEMNLVVADTRVSIVHTIKNKMELKGLNLHDVGGGTTMMPALNYIVEKKWDKFGTVLLTDGWTDSLDTTALGTLLVLYTEDECPISAGKVKQIKIPDDYRD